LKEKGKSKKAKVRRRLLIEVGRTKTVLTFTFCLFTFSFFGCALKASRAGIPLEAQAAIDAATSNIAEGNYEKIYTEAADEWRQATTLEESNQTFKQLKERLGNVKGRSFHSATEEDTTDAHSFIITYKTSFDRADGMETFTLVERQGRWLLARYFVNSEALK
jgi:hypothetical protein